MPQLKWKFVQAWERLKKIGRKLKWKPRTAVEAGLVRVIPWEPPAAREERLFREEEERRGEGWENALGIW